MQQTIQTRHCLGIHWLFTHKVVLERKVSSSEVHGYVLQDGKMECNNRNHLLIMEWIISCCYPSICTCDSDFFVFNFWHGHPLIWIYLAYSKFSSVATNSYHIYINSHCLNKCVHGVCSTKWHEVFAFYFAITANIRYMDVNYYKNKNILKCYRMLGMTVLKIREMNSTKVQNPQCVINELYIGILPPV